MVVLGLAAEVALVGKAYGAYNLMLGGGHHGQRLNKIYRYSIKEDEILDILKPLFKRWSLKETKTSHLVTGVLEQESLQKLQKGNISMMTFLKTHKFTRNTKQKKK